jgi:MFS transporter, DHA1 family, tetracycline resistance protein
MIGNMSRRWAGLTRSAWWGVAPLLGIQLLSGMWYLPQMSFFPIYLEERLGYASVTIAALVAASQVAGMVAGVAGGVLTDRLGSKWVLVLGLVCSGLASLVFHTRTPWLAAVLWTLGGLGLAFCTLGGSSYLTAVADRASLGVLSAGYALCMTLGGALSNPAAGILLDGRGFSPFGLAMSALVLLTLTFTLVGLPTLRANNPPGPVARRVGWAASLAMVQRPVVRMLLGLRLLPTIFYGMLGVLMPLLINRAAGSKTMVAAYTTATLVLASVAQLVAGRAADRYGSRVPTLVSFGTLVAGAFGLAAFSDRLWGLFGFGILATAAAWALSALLFCLVAAGVSQREHGKMFGLLHATWSMGMIAGALLGGSLVRLSQGLPFMAAGLLNIGSIALTLVFLARVASIQAVQPGETGSEAA